MKNNSIKSLPFILNYDRYYFAWGGKRHKGYFIDPEGNVLTYDVSENWNLCSLDYDPTGYNYIDGYEENAYITPELLFQNLEKATIKPNRKTIDRAKVEQMITDIENSAIESIGSDGCDIGSGSHNIYIYHQESNSYRKSIICTAGDKVKRNKSRYASDILRCFLIEIKNN